jgi:hypothetical protein
MVKRNILLGWLNGVTVYQEVELEDDYTFEDWIAIHKELGDKFKQWKT